MTDILQSTSTWKMLDVFLKQPWKGIHLRALIREAGMGPNTAHRIVKELEKERILKSEKAGNIILYHLNEKNEVSKKLLMLYHERKLQKLPEEFKIYVNRLRRKLKSKQILSMVLFGSVARGKANQESDIDLLIISKEIFDSKDIRDIFEKYSRYIQVMNQTETEFEKNYRNGHALIINMIKDGRVIVDNNFFYSYLFMPIPKPTKEYLENILKYEDKELETLLKIHEKNKFDRLIGPLLYPILNKLATLIILLNHNIPESRKDIEKQLEKLKENEFVKWLRKTRKIWDGELIELSEKELDNITTLIRKKIDECYMRLESYE